MTRNRSSLPRELRDKLKPWRETQLKEIRLAVKKADGNKWLAAILLGVGKTTVYRKLNSITKADRPK